MCNHELVIVASRNENNRKLNGTRGTAIFSRNKTDEYFGVIGENIIKIEWHHVLFDIFVHYWIA